MASVLPLISILAAIVLLGLTGNLFSSSPFVIAAQVAAVLLNVWARTSFKKGTFRVTAAPSGTSVITRGAYRLIRHPMYSAALHLGRSRRPCVRLYGSNRNRSHNPMHHPSHRGRTTTSCNVS